MRLANITSGGAPDAATEDNTFYAVIDEAFNPVSDESMQYLEIVQYTKHERTQRMKTQRA